MAVERKTLAEQIVIHIRDRISQNVYRPGQKLTIQGLAEELQVSMTPVREALKTLAAERLVEVTPNKSVVVAELDPAEIAQVLLVYSRLEMLAGELSAARRDPAALARLRDLSEQTKAAVVSNDYLAYFHANQDFHLALAEASGNATLVELHRNLNARLYHVRFRGGAHSDPAGWAARAREHDAIVEAIDSGDRETTARLLEHHFRGARYVLEESGRESIPLAV